MTFDTATRRPALANEQDPGDAATFPAALGGNERGQACLAIQREQRCLDVGDDGLGLPHRNEAARLVPGEDVNRPTLSADREGGFELNVPAGSAKQPDCRVHNCGVGLVQQPIHTLALPPHMELNVGTERLAQRSELVEAPATRHSIANCALLQPSPRDPPAAGLHGAAAAGSARPNRSVSTTRG